MLKELVILMLISVPIIYLGKATNEVFKLTKEEMYEYKKQRGKM